VTPLDSLAPTRAPSRAAARGARIAHIARPLAAPVLPFVTLALVLVLAAGGLTSLVCVRLLRASTVR
jgi:hypothetical protein